MGQTGPKPAIIRSLSVALGAGGFCAEAILGAEFEQQDFMPFYGKLGMRPPAVDARTVNRHII
jgi:hypothetical protein